LSAKGELFYLTATVRPSQVEKKTDGTLAHFVRSELRLLAT
jgi:hypothetical protein